VRTYEFTLKFDLVLVTAGPDEYVELLAEHGCDDALLGIGQAGRLALAFDWESESAREAVLSAIADVKIALPAARLVEVAPDLVGVTEVADIVGRSRQNIRQLMLNCGTVVPAPVHEGKSSIWHLAHVLTWLREQRRYRIEDDLLELAQTNMQVNVAVDQRNADSGTQEAIAAVLA
jgi:hypothetical protein